MRRTFVFESAAIMDTRVTTITGSAARVRNSTAIMTAAGIVAGAITTVSWLSNGAIIIGTNSKALHCRAFFFHGRKRDTA